MKLAISDIVFFQEEKDGEPPKDALDDLFPNDEEENSQGSKRSVYYNHILRRHTVSD